MYQTMAVKSNPRRWDEWCSYLGIPRKVSYLTLALRTAESLRETIRHDVNGDCMQRFHLESYECAECP